MTPLHHAASSKSKKCLELLLSHGADVNVKDKVSNSNIRLKEKKRKIVNDIIIEIIICSMDRPLFFCLAHMIVEENTWSYYYPMALT